MSLKVLLVDDDNIVIFFQKMILKTAELSSNPFSFENGKPALQYLTEHYSSEDFYLIFLDINMPEVDGWDFLDEAHKKWSSDNVAVVMVTSSIDPTDRVRASQYSMVIDFLPKPLTIEQCKKIMLLPQIKDFFNL